VEFPAEAAVKFIQRLEQYGITSWVDGGWAVDALLGQQTRPHEDLDIVIQEKDLPLLSNLLQSLGYQDVVRGDTCPWNFVKGNSDGLQVDVHVIVLDAQGNGIYGPAEKGEMYPAVSLLGKGTIDGHLVKCIAPEYLVAFHTGYAVDENDFKDVSALCARFGIALPPDYQRFVPRAPESTKDDLNV
jgi:lincosamide nucleotidyltransferase A/C/D/E